MRGLITATLVLIASAASAQQQPRVRWNLSAGPSVAMAEKYFWLDGGVCGGTNCDPGEDVIAGGVNGKYHAALGISREFRRTALVLRGEVLYNRIESPASSRSIWYRSAIGPVFLRNALRDETYLVSVGLEWDAFPSRTASPYLLTTTGLLINLLAWSRDTTSTRPDQLHGSYGFFAAPGLGFRVRVCEPELFTEWRSYSIIGAPASRFAPLSVGVRF